MPTSAPLSSTRTDCRLCGSARLAPAFSLTPTPPANALVRAEDLSKPQPVFPLDLFLCQDCSHLQLLTAVSPSLLFENYLYVSGTSPVFVRHFESYAADVISYLGLQKGGFVVDIGSNDGVLLRAFQKRAMSVLGVDPAKEIAARASSEGIETIPEFFTPDLAAAIRRRQACSLVTANNVFAHADDLAGIVRGVGAMLAEDGVFVFEVSYLADVIDKALFDTIYHEHLSYHSVRPLKPFLLRNGMEIFRVERVDTHGGSIRVFAQLKGGPRMVDASVDGLIAMEKRMGLDRLETFAEFSAKINRRKAKLTRAIAEIKARNKHIAGFGAPAKATTLMYHFGLGPETIDFIVDDSPLKQGLFTPGLHIPVVGSSAIGERKPNYLLILAWNFAASILEKQKEFANGGGRFIIPLPKVKII